jgi:hypothetical protein
MRFKSARRQDSEIGKNGSTTIYLCYLRRSCCFLRIAFSLVSVPESSTPYQGLSGVVSAFTHKRRTLEDSEVIIVTECGQDMGIENTLLLGRPFLECMKSLLANKYRLDKELGT